MPERKPQITTDPSQLSNSIGALAGSLTHSLTHTLIHYMARSLARSLTPRRIIALVWLDCGRMINMQSAKRGKNLSSGGRGRNIDVILIE